MASTIGKVKWFNDLKGYGFITAPGIEGDVFVHFTAITMEGFKTLRENCLVQFELQPTDRGFMATAVQLCDQAQAEGHILS
ncbi:cold-shock protein [Aquabacterium sp. CECT 9606]|uniref:cold-shock protein n=1 Tax=Aquabacterium sp. CECT 9606 TaxID=2845822 RepID=UPI001E38645E|nr:cold shock domain-containing protein [Aquabacterium sp. CECT 9606]CAH0356110.1 Cold shock-like protein [Aquabacterium sp. CECT 9606]